MTVSSANSLLFTDLRNNWGSYHLQGNQSSPSETRLC